VSPNERDRQDYIDAQVAREPVYRACALAVVVIVMALAGVIVVILLSGS
jgi:hypothetical protein